MANAVSTRGKHDPSRDFVACIEREAVHRPHHRQPGDPGRALRHMEIDPFSP
jgi:hypothetical protein